MTALEKEVLLEQRVARKPLGSKHCSALESFQPVPMLGILAKEVISSLGAGHSGGSTVTEQDTMLDSHRVLDLTEDGCMLCGKVLGDLGADVIQIEPPAGNPTRNIGPFYHDIADPEKSLTWFFLGLNKRGITLNLETADGRDIFKRLVKTADFVVESFEPGYMKSLGLGYEELEKIKPDIIMTSITPFGQTGPHVHYKVTDIVGVALSGMMWLYGEADRAPVRIPAPQFHLQGGLQGAMGTMVAHYHRELTGEGQHVDQSCQQAVILTLMISAEVWDLNRFNIRGQGPGDRRPRATPPGPLFRKTIYQCKDGYVMALFIGGAQAGAVASSRALVEWANEDGYMLELRDFDWPGLDAERVSQEDIDHLACLLAEFLETKTKAECLERAVEHAILLIPVNNAKDVLGSPQLAYRGFFRPVDHPELGETIAYPLFPVMMNDTHPGIQRRAPLIGQHNDEIYENELGIPREQLVLLKKRGVI
jgi:crotonobetainyl-CoA:carnitine CoA-transferase CaiB-like acyl-CoA transferase